MIAVAVAGLAALIIAIAVALMLKSSSQQGGPQVMHVAATARGANRMQAGLRRRQAGRREADEDSEEEDLLGGRRRGGRHGGHQAREEEEEEEAAPARGPTKKDAYEARRKAREAEREALEAAQEAEFRRAAEERQRREEEEAAKWMHTFTVEAVGDEVDTQQEEALLDRLVAYIVGRKAVALDELAAEFRLRSTEASGWIAGNRARSSACENWHRPCAIKCMRELAQAVVAHVQALEEAGRLTGVMDDRGKFIYISREEMEAAAVFIRARGRVAIAELAASSAEFLDLSAAVPPPPPPPPLEVEA
eukprot:scaffold6.g2582.t1